MGVVCHDRFESPRIHVTKSKGEDQLATLVRYVISAEAVTEFMGQRPCRTLRYQTIDHGGAVSDYRVAVWGVTCRFHAVVVLTPDPGNAATDVQWEIVLPHEHHEVRALLHTQRMYAG